MEKLFALASEASCTIGHYASSLSDSNLLAEVSFAAQAELTIIALRNVQCNNVVASLKVGHALTYALHNASAFMAQHRGEQALGIRATQCESICVAHTCCRKFNANL